MPFRSCVRKLGNRHEGFTLIEFAMVMLISGLIMAALFHVYKIYLTDKYMREIYNKQLTLSSGFSTFYSSSLRYPCPADPTLKITDPDAGLEGIPGPNVDRCQNLLEALPNDGDCTGPGGTGICRVAGTRSVYNATLGSTDFDPVFIGGIPYRSLKAGAEYSGTRDKCYSKADGSEVVCDPLDPTQYNPSEANYDAAARSDSLDPWGFQMTYAVTASQTFAATYDVNYGSISVFTENGDPLVSGTAHFVVVAHGENHRGAYSQQGNISFPCQTGLDETENCDNDSTFVAGLRRMGNTPRYFDDVMIYRAFSINELWKIGGSEADPTIYNAIIGGKVGIGTTTPTVDLEVAGDVLSERLRVQRICSTEGNCFEPEKLGVDGSGITCPQSPGPVQFGATGFAHNIVTGCIPVAAPSGFQGQSCGEDEYIVGFSSAGLICRNLSDLSIDP